MLDAVQAFQYLKGAYRNDGDKSFTRACCGRRRVNGFKVKKGTFSLDKRKEFF